MNRKDFWRIVETVRQRVHHGNPGLPINQRCEQYQDYLEKELQPLNSTELESFQDHLQLTVAAAYTSELFGASYLLNGGGSEDGFYYFRAWLVFQGREIHEQAIANPDSLADICPTQGLADYECEEVLNIAKGLYEKRTGKMMEWRSDPGDLGQRKPGNQWKTKDLPKLLPRLAGLPSD
jgi:Protein of unknown function (DUF4240)